jgi:predicted PhzF superfamily epimerase YddE/YHI9
MQLLTVDAFTAEPFRGNPAGVCFLDGARPDTWMQSVAAELNLSETAFLLQEAAAFRLRWFTPTTEVPLCGHATLASAHALWSTGRLGADREARFDTKSGRLTARRVGTRIQMDFPSIPVAPAPLPPEAAAALGAKPIVATNTVEALQRNYLLELDSEATVRGLKPDFAALRPLPWGFIVTARSAGGAFDFVSRYFAGHFGIDEDPVTGSAHCSLTPYWAAKLGKSSLVGHQVSARGGVVHVELKGDRVLLSGDAITVLKGELAV